MYRFSVAIGLMISVVNPVFAVVEYEQMYPASVQTIVSTDIFQGDSHDEFAGDYVAVVEDMAGWKIHPEDRAKYESWAAGDRVRIRYRTEPYWFKREHKFWMYNHMKDETCRVMIVQHSEQPVKSIVFEETLTKEVKFRKQKVVWGQVIEYECWETVPYAKILELSDGSVWKIQNPEKFDKYTKGTPVYVGVQGTPDIEYDFILITGLEREAESTRAKLEHF